MLLGRKCIGTIAFFSGLEFGYTRFNRSWGQLVQYNCERLCQNGEYIDQGFSGVNQPQIARNELVKSMRGDWLLQLDSDHSFDPDLVERLLHRMDQYGVDVVSGLYFGRFHPHKPIAYTKGEDGAVYQIAEWPNEPFQIASAGAGCLMVKRSVFDRINNELGEEPFALRPPMLEDHSFFARLDQLGIPALIDPRIIHKHLAIKGIGPDDYDRDCPDDPQ